MLHLTIPNFLRREPTVATNRRRVKRTLPKYVMPKLPNSKKPPKTRTYHGATKVVVHLNDQCHRIGSGHRMVWAKRGHKWVHLCDVMGNRGKMRVADFHRVVKE
tara:strand:- start:48 stop:359 length:312 start_codon:yes stop_codon:yes gene_type:complete